MATYPAEIFICWHTVITSKLSRYALLSIKCWLVISCFFMPPTAAKKEKEFFGDTPNPGKGLRPLHSCFVRCQWLQMGFSRMHYCIAFPEPRQRTASSALLYYIAFKLIVVNHLVGVLT